MAARPERREAGRGRTAALTVGRRPRPALGRRYGPALGAPAVTLAPGGRPVLDVAFAGPERAWAFATMRCQRATAAACGRRALFLP
jgi:hypothetical protein